MTIEINVFWLALALFFCEFHGVIMGVLISKPAVEGQEQRVKELEEALEECLLVIKHNDDLGWGDVCTKKAMKALKSTTQRKEKG